MSQPASATPNFPSTSPGSGTSTLQPSANSTAAATSLPSPSTAALSPETLANNFNAGANAGAPASAGTEALSNNAIHAMQPQAPFHSEAMNPPPIAATVPSSAAPLFETAHAAHTPVDAPPPAPSPDASPTVVAAPAAPAAPSMAQAPVAPVPTGPLPAYGADLRPAAAATAPAGPAPAPMTAPGSAPVNPGSANALNQPAVVRHQPSGAPHANPAAGLTENAVAATTTGAIAGAGAAQAQAQQRLQRLLDAVARQEPKLRWTIGDREDGSTVLATDLASGWIPPHIQIPTGITLLAPSRRNGTLEAMLGETTLTAAYAPGQYVPPAGDDEPASTRARQVADDDELGWELAQATKWRDGLPRLAHTLAKAASSGTGYLDSEIDLLREHLQRFATQVLTDYPESVDAATVGNWQLLATIDSLIENERTCANYHLAWFQALNLALKGEENR